MKATRRSIQTSIIALVLCISMLVGTTFAWFTDIATSKDNVIQSGNLKAEMYWSESLLDADSQEWVNAENTKVFDYNKWEPGYTELRYVKVVNNGNLNFKWKISLTAEGKVTSLSDVIDVYYVNPVTAALTKTDLLNETPVGSLTDVLADNTATEGSLTPDSCQIFAIAFHMDELAGNEYQETSLCEAGFSLRLLATQATGEFDSFDDQYDSNAAADFFPGFQGGSASAAVTTDDQGVTTSEASMNGGDVSAIVPAGVMVADGVKALGLTVNSMDTSGANIQLNDSEKMNSLDVHVEGVADGNTTPILVTLEGYLTTGINTGALRLYHVENGNTVVMTQVANPTNHNEFSYDPATGDVTLAMASFSEVAVVADTNNPWNGETLNYLWYNTTDKELTIYNADQLAGFGAIVDGKAEGIAQDNFAGKTVKLGNNIYLSGKLFDPIGWGYVNTTWNSGGVDGKVFQGTFDGNNMTILDLHQSGWDLEAENSTDYTYTNCGFGLFAAASGANFKDLTISGAYVKVECVEAGVLVGLSQNNCTYSNIKILDSKIANYQRPAGGLIGEVSGKGTTTITNVVIAGDVVVGSLWGDFDAPVGGVIGAYWNDVDADPQIYMTNIDVGCRLDVYNDITSAYQWHAYRRAGMLIGNTDMTDPNNAHKAYAPFLHCSDVRVYYGDWVNYHYCRFTNQDNTWANNYPWVRVEAGENCSAYSNPRYGQPVVGGVTVSTDDHTCTGEHHMVRQFSQLYGGGQGVYGQDKHHDDGVSYPDAAYSITYVNDGKTLDVIYVPDNSEPFPVGSDQAQKLVMEWAKDNIAGGTIAFGGWMNAASIKLKDIPANNTKNIVLYPYFDSPYTASFVDQSGNILDWCLFNNSDITRLAETFATAKANLPDPGEDFELINWIIRGTNLEDGKVKVEMADNNTNWESFKSYKDVTITPHYRYKGADLIEVFDELTGEIDHYEVAGYSGGVGSTIVEIPDYVNGKPVTTVNANAFSSYDDLHSVRIPGTITKFGYQSFTADNPNRPGSQRDTVTLYWEGDPAVWNAAMNDYNDRVFNDDSLLQSGWDNMMGEGSCVFFLDENGKVDLSKGYWELAEVRDPDSFLGLGRMFVWQYHNHAYGSTSGCGNEHNNSTNYTDNCKCDLGTHVRPDKEYWEDVTIN